MGCMTTCLKYLIIVCNLILAMIGIVLLAAGIMLIVDSPSIIRIFFPDYEAIRGWNFSSSISGNGTSSSSPSPVGPGSGVDFSSEFLRPFAIALIVSGSVIFVIAFVGVAGICCSSYRLLITYAVVLIIIIIAEISLSVLFFVKQFDKEIKKEVKNTLVKHYVDFDDPSDWSLLWNNLMIKHSCCGVDGYEDFNSSQRWSRDRFFDELNVTLVAPIVCCKNATDYRRHQQQLKCAVNPTRETSNWDQGCWGKIDGVLERYRVTVIGIVCAIVVAEAVMALIAIVVAWTLYKTSKDF